MSYSPKATDSRMWKSIMKRVPKVMDNVQIVLRSKNSFFWFDRWLASGPLATQITDITNQRVHIRECWLEHEWNVELLKELVGESITAEIVQNRVSERNELDICVWKPSSNGKFTMTTAWEVTREKGVILPWHNWLWNKDLPKKISMCNWRAWFQSLAVDERVKNKGIALALACDCCSNPAMESIDHVLSTSQVAS